MKKNEKKKSFVNDRRKKRVLKLQLDKKLGWIKKEEQEEERSKGENQKARECLFLFLIFFYKKLRIKDFLQEGREREKGERERESYKLTYVHYLYKSFKG